MSWYDSEDEREMLIEAGLVPAVLSASPLTTVSTDGQADSAVQNRLVPAVLSASPLTTVSSDGQADSAVQNSIEDGLAFLRQNVVAKAVGRNR
jgi:hypothetical protein